MSELKNIKVPESTHDLLISRAKALGMKKQVLAAAVIDHGLNLPLEEIQRIVVNAQLATKQQSDCTNPAQTKEKRQFPASSGE
jgi:hypothetical protein